MKDCKDILEVIENKKDAIFAVERHIWQNPEPGYKEWKTHAYLKDLYENLGLTVCEFGNIPGFYTDIDTGRPGPTLAVFGEMDSLIIPTHSECDKETGAVHACGHNCQCAALYGLAIALCAPGALDGLSGRIRLIAVPAEELIDLEFRKSLKEKGIIRFFGGKQELIYRGILDDVDMAMMVHQASTDNFACGVRSNGCMVKVSTFKGKSAHAGGAPHNGINALYAAETALAAANALRETFIEDDHIRFHPIITAGGDTVNSIPDKVVLESYIRGVTMDAISKVNDKINRAFAGAAAAIGCELIIDDFVGYMPRFYDDGMRDVIFNAAEEVIPANKVDRTPSFSNACSDLGDVSAIMPAVHPNIGGQAGAAHSDKLVIADPYLACISNAKLQYISCVRFLENDAAKAKEIVAGYKPVYASKQEYLDDMNRMELNMQAVTYNEDGSIKIIYKK